MNCRNCQQSVNENFCGNCGMPVILKRVDGHYISHEIQHILHFEKGILYTIKALLFRPGQNIRAFISEDRSRLVKPIIFVIITSLIYTSIAHFFHLEKSRTIPGAGAHSATMAIMSWIKNHYGYANIIMSIFIGCGLKLIYKRSGYNFFEILIMLCFVMGMGMLIFAGFALVQGILGIDLSVAAEIISIGYCSWAIVQFMDGRKAVNYLFVLMAYTIGAISFWASAFLMGAIIDAFIKV